MVCYSLSKCWLHIFRPVTIVFFLLKLQLESQGGADHSFHTCWRMWNRREISLWSLSMHTGLFSDGNLSIYIYSTSPSHTTTNYTSVIWTFNGYHIQVLFWQNKTVWKERNKLCLIFIFRLIISVPLCQCVLKESNDRNNLNVDSVNFLQLKWISLIWFLSVSSVFQLLFSKSTEVTK